MAADLETVVETWVQVSFQALYPFCKSVAGTWYLPGMSFHESIVLSIRRVFVRIGVSDFVKVNLLKVFLEFFKIISPLPNSFLRFYC